MNKVDKFLEFIIEHLDDPRISVFKKIKYGHRYYYVNFYIDQETNTQNKKLFQYQDSMEIVFDNRNYCIEIIGGEGSNSLIIEDSKLLEKWSNILEEIVSKNLENRVIDIFEKTLSECCNKNLHRELQMKKIFKQDERL